MSSSTNNIVTVERRGFFNDDSFFKDSWGEWDRAMRDAVDRWDRHTGSPTKTITSSHPINEASSVYRQIRSSNVTSDESQAVSCVEEDDKYKLVLDVKDFSPSDINVKALESTIVVEGKIERKEGDSVSTQTFVRRFHLPPSVNMNAVSSALSRDGVLTISAPKLVSAITKGTSQTVPVQRTETTTTKLIGTTEPQITSYQTNYAAGKPTEKERLPFNPSGSGPSIVNTYFSTDPHPQTTRNRVTETITVNVPDRRGSEKVIRTITETGKDDWDSFNQMVERSQKEMDDMMRKHTITTPSTYALTPTTTTNFVSVPSGANTTKDIIRDGNTVTERQQQKWDDAPAPGVHRSNRAASESSQIKNTDGKVVGNKLKREMESKAEGSREEILPDGTKCKIFTKSYETKNSFQASSNGKAL